MNSKSTRRSSRNTTTLLACNVKLNAIREKIKDIIIHFQSKQTLILKENCRSLMTHGGNAILRLKDFSRQIATHNRLNWKKMAIFSRQIVTHKNPFNFPEKLPYFLVKWQHTKILSVFFQFPNFSSNLYLHSFPDLGGREKWKMVRKMENGQFLLLLRIETPH